MTTAEFTIDNGGDEAAERKNARTVLLAFLGALLLHLIVGFSLAAWNGVFTPTAPVEEKPIELTFVDQSAPAPIAPKNANFIETDESKKAPEPKEKTFESNANSIGASEIAASGDMPLPSQQGKDRPFMNLETHSYSLAERRCASAAECAAKPPAFASAAGRAGRQTNLPLLTQHATTTAERESTQSSAATETSVYRPEQERTTIRGNILEPRHLIGECVRHATGALQKQVHDAIGSRWYLVRPASVRHVSDRNSSARVLGRSKRKGQRSQGVREHKQRSVCELLHSIDP